MLPESLLKEAQEELLDWRGQGASILEIGHRSDEFKQLMREAETDLRILLNIPENYHVLFLGGAARTQFAMIPMNLLANDKKAGYIISGVWSSLAYEEAQKCSGQAYCVASSSPQNFFTLPSPADWIIQDDTAYLYYTPNETINGVQFHEKPDAGGIPLVADMTSCLLSEPINVSDYGLIFAGAQKNIAIAGLTIVIIDSALLEKKTSHPIPTMLDYRVHAQNHSLYATPPVFNCYLAAKMFQWVKTQGGIRELYRKNRLKADKLYQFIDTSTFYECKVQKNARSIMNVCFSLVRKDLEDLFLQQARKNGLIALKGHRITGGLRASIYNAMPMDGVDSLIEFMQCFAEEHHS
ncbi:phosphoserine aminotransferase [Legionella londiniensis]|uniref:Phosphoserine aminotransferase n=2 Tax=Legionella londiniensis TaxID=45068 RepID=A0A0W0VQY2_9GAMM|nr:phosphoserine aminotransferase [Legionella londiniensis]STX93077.1 phosphoserine aminotransferase [Legionella londiniensis]